MTNLSRFLLLWILLAGCRSAAPNDVFDCSDFAEEPLRGIHFENIHPYAFERWVTREYEVMADKVNTLYGERVIGNARVFWAYNDREYSAIFTDNKLEYIDVRWEDTRPPQLTVEQLIQCVGSPSSYSAILQDSAHGPYVTVYLWYEAEGLVFTGSVLGSTTISDRFPIDQFIVTQPDDVEGMLLSFNSVGSDFSTPLLDALQPWPGTLDGVIPHSPR